MIRRSRHVPQLVKSALVPDQAGRRSRRSGRLWPVPGGGPASDFSLASTLFDGTTSYLDQRDSYEYIDGRNVYMDFKMTEAFSISVWFKTSNAGAQAIVSKYGSGIPNGWLFRITGGQLYMYMVYSGTSGIVVRTNATTFADGVWHHAVMAFNGSTAAAGVHIYVDGADEPLTIVEDGYSGFGMSNTRQFRIGSRDDLATYFDGNIDDVSIHGRGLTAADVTTLFNGGLPGDVRVDGPRDALLGYWKMGDGAIVPWVENKNGFPYPSLTKSILVNPGNIATGGEDRIRFGDFPEADFTVFDSFTVGIWFSCSPRAGVVFGKNDGSPPGPQVRGYRLEIGSSSAAFYLNASDGGSGAQSMGMSTGTNVTDGRWHMVVGTYNGNSTGQAGAAMEMGVDGRVRIGSYSGGNIGNFGRSIANNGEVTAGAYGSYQQTEFVGNVAHSFIYKGVLSHGQIKALYGNGVPQDLSIVGPQPNSDFSQTAIEFDGTNDYVTMGNVLDFERTDTMSVSCWFKATAATSPMFMVAKQAAAGPVGWALFMGGGLISFEMINAFPGNYINIATDDAFNDGNWHHALATYSGSSTAAGITIYIDGVAVATTVGADTLSATTINSADLYIGSRDLNDPTDNYTGSIDDVAVYDAELSLAEVQAIYASGVPVDNRLLATAPSLVGYWLMGDGNRYPTLRDRQVATPILAAGTIKDRSRSSNGGTPTNMEDGDFTGDTPGGVSGFSATFDGTNEDILIGNIAALNFERTDAFSISAWVKTSNSGVVISKFNTQGWFANINVGGNVEFALWVTSGNRLLQNTTATFNDGVWHHVVWAYDGSQLGTGLTFIVDGVIEAKSAASETLVSNIANADDVRIGSLDTGSSYFDGQLDDVAVYDKALSLAEAQAIYNSGAPTDNTLLDTERNLVGYWGMGEAANDGTMVNMLSSTVITLHPKLVHWSALGDGGAIGVDGVPDLSGLGNHGTTSGIAAGRFQTFAPAGQMLADRSVNNNKGQYRAANLASAHPFRSRARPNGDLIGEHIPDLSPSQNPTTSYSGVAWTSVSEDAPNDGVGFLENSILFYVSGHHFALLGDLAELSFERTDPFTVSAWVKHLDDGVEHTYFSKQANANETGWSCWIDNTDRFGIEICNTTTTNHLRVRSTNTFSNGWHHVVLSYDGSSTPAGISIVVDGVEETNSVVNNTLSASILNSAVVQIAGRDGGNMGGLSWEDRIASICVYDTGLLVAEMQAIYNSGVPIDNRTLATGSSIVGYWRPGDAGPGGVVKRQAYFNRATGDDNYLTMGPSPELEFERTDVFSASVWVKQEVGANNEWVLSKVSSGLQGWGIYSRATTGEIEFYIVGGDFTTAADAVETTAGFIDACWHHVIVTNAGTGLGGMKIYVDGVDQPLATIVNTLGANSTLGDGPFNIANRTDTTAASSNIGISNVAVYDKVLSSGEVTTLFNSSQPVDHTVTGPTASLVGYWDMETFTPGVVDMQMINMDAGDFVGDVPPSP